MLATNPSKYHFWQRMHKAICNYIVHTYVILYRCSRAAWRPPLCTRKLFLVWCISFDRMCAPVCHSPEITFNVRANAVNNTARATRTRGAAEPTNQQHSLSLFATSGRLCCKCCSFFIFLHFLYPVVFSLASPTIFRVPPCSCQLQTARIFATHARK